MYERTPETRRAEYERRKERGGVRKQAIMKSYGLEWAAYENMLKEQNNRCAICENSETSLARKSTGELRPLAVDHDHETGRIRGLLCRSCNHLIGNANDDIDILNKAILYLIKYKG